MKLKELTIQSFLGINEAEIKFEKPVTLFAGKNNSGKSSIRDAIVFGLTGKARAMDKFKDAGMLANNSLSSSNGMFVQMELENDSGDPVHIGRSKSSASLNIDKRAILSYCLNPKAFISLPARERGALLSQVLGGGLKDIAKEAVVKHIGNVDKTVLAQIKASGVDILMIDAFKTKVVELRQEYKRDLATRPSEPPLLADQGLEQDYDPEKDKEAVTVLGERMKKGADLIPKAKEQLKIKAGIIDDTKEIEKLEGERVEVPPMPEGVSEGQLEQTHQDMIRLLALLENSSAKNISCPLCRSNKPREKIEKRASGFVEFMDKYSASFKAHEAAKECNGELENKLSRLKSELKSLNERLDPADLPEGAETLLTDLQAERDQKQVNLTAYDRHTTDMALYTEATKRRGLLEGLIKETNRIDSALKDGGPVKSHITKHGRKLPINEKLLKLWGMEALEWSDNGDISLNNHPIEYASDSEQYRGSCVMGLALADITNVGIAALDGFDILDRRNSNYFFEAVCDCKLNNVLVFATDDRQFSSEQTSKWLDIFMVKDGEVMKV